MSYEKVYLLYIFLKKNDLQSFNVHFFYKIRRYIIYRFGIIEWARSCKFTRLYIDIYIHWTGHNYNLIDIIKKSLTVNSIEFNKTKFDVEIYFSCAILGKVLKNACTDFNF